MTDGSVQEVWADGNQIVYQLYNDSDRQETAGLIDGDFERTISAEGTAFHRTPPPAERPSNGWLTAAMLIGGVAVVVFVVLRAMARRNGVFGAILWPWARACAVLIDGGKKVTFADVGGCEEAKLGPGDVIDFLKRPQRAGSTPAPACPAACCWTDHRAAARPFWTAVAGETNAKFYSVSASEFIELFVGVARVVPRYVRNGNQERPGDHFHRRT